MRTSLNEIKTIDDFLNKKLPSDEMLLMEAKLINAPGLRINLFLQRKVYQLVSLFHREQLREELQRHHDEIFNDPNRDSFRQSVLQLFK